MSDSSPRSDFDTLIAELPRLAAEAVTIDVASCMPGGERSDEHDATLAAARELRDHLRRGENAALRALIAIGYDASSALRWLRSNDEKEPRFQSANPDLVEIPVFTPESLARKFKQEREQEGGSTSCNASGVNFDS